MEGGFFTSAIALDPTARYINRASFGGGIFWTASRYHANVELFVGTLSRLRVTRVN